MVENLVTCANASVGFEGRSYVRLNIWRNKQLYSSLKVQRFIADQSQVHARAIDPVIGRSRM